MTELPIPASAIEAAARAMWEDYQDETTAEEQVAHEEEVEEALRAAFEELGMEREQRSAWHGGPYQWRNEQRLVSRWMPMEES